MQYLYPSEKIYSAQSFLPKAGRGVFAKILIQRNEIIEICPVIELPDSEVIQVKRTLLRNYLFSWGAKQQTVAVGLGYSSLYNHSYTNANATYEKIIDEMCIKYVAIKDIQKDTEIFVNYNSGNPFDTTPLWITDIPQP